jgi:hypothetical protein
VSVRSDLPSEPLRLAACQQRSILLRTRTESRLLYVVGLAVLFDDEQPSPAVALGLATSERRVGRRGHELLGALGDYCFTQDNSATFFHAAIDAIKIAHQTTGTDINKPADWG